MQFVLGATVFAFGIMIGHALAVNAINQTNKDK